MKKLKKRPNVVGWKRGNFGNGVITYTKGNAMVLCDLNGKWWKVKQS